MFSPSLDRILLNHLRVSASVSLAHLSRSSVLPAAAWAPTALRSSHTVPGWGTSGTLPAPHPEVERCQAVAMELAAMPSRGYGAGSKIRQIPSLGAARQADTVHSTSESPGPLRAASPAAAAPRALASKTCRDAEEAKRSGVPGLGVGWRQREAPGPCVRDSRGAAAAPPRRAGLTEAALPCPGRTRRSGAARRGGAGRRHRRAARPGAPWRRCRAARRRPAR